MFTNASSRVQGAHPVIQRFFDVSLYLLLFMGFAMLAGTSRLDVFSLCLGILAFTAKGYLLLRSNEFQIPEQWTSYITFIYAAMFVLDYFLISQSFIAALVHMVLLLVFLKMFAIHRERDYVYLELLAFGMVLAAAVLTVDSLFFIIFCFFALLAVMTFVTMEMRRSWIAAQPDARTQVRNPLDLRHLPVSVSRVCLLLVFTIVLGTGMLFFLLPRRPSTGYLGALAPRSNLSTGFSEEVSLGDIGRIQQSSAVVMHVKFAPGTRVPADLRWRGVALATFDGRRWSGTLGDGPVEATNNGSFSATAFTSRLFVGYNRRVSYHVELEPFGARVFFVLPEALFINGRYQIIRIDSTGTIFNMDNSRSITEYGVVSEIPPPMPANLAAAGNTEVDRIYTQLPPRVDTRIARLAQEVSAAQPTPFLKARAIERYLSSTYGYTLQLPDTPPTDPVANFLFVRKRGHCEYFASSMVVMLRTLGIPSRLVNGFRGGEYNDITSSYIVRAKDAHSWVEAFFPSYGWYTFDPTPASTEAPNPWSRLGLYADAMREFWHDWVVNYDTGHQTTLGFAMIKQSRSQFENASNWMDSLYRSCLRDVKALRAHFQRHTNGWTAWTSVGVVLVMALLLGPKLFTLIRQMRLARKPSLEPHSAATIWYGRALKMLSKRGIRKTPTQTPQEFLETVSAAPVRRHLQEFTLHYERARFGDSVSDAEKLPELYRELETVAKN
jgi:protein-glutamine gamma-glutamyltransferase